MPPHRGQLKPPGTQGWLKAAETHPTGGREERPARGSGTSPGCVGPGEGSAGRGPPEQGRAGSCLLWAVRALLPASPLLALWGVGHGT